MWTPNFQRVRRVELFRYYLMTRQKRTPTPEHMFRTLIKRGTARIQRRRGKPPLLVFLKDV